MGTSRKPWQIGNIPPYTRVAIVEYRYDVYPFKFAGTIDKLTFKLQQAERAVSTTGRLLRRHLKVDISGDRHPGHHFLKPGGTFCHSVSP